MQNLPELLKIDEMIAQEPSFLKIMADGIVTDEELKEQSEKVAALIEETEKRFQGEDLQFVKKLLPKLMFLRQFIIITNFKTLPIMSTFNKKAILPATTSQISDMAKAIEQEFYKDGYDVRTDTLMNGGCDISITKGGTFKAVLGMRSALKVSLTPTLNGVQFDAHVGIFGQQAIPTVISMFFFWPVLITQIWGMVSQSKMDDRALAAAQGALVASSMSHGIFGNTGANKFCTSCGAEVPADAAFCPKCGTKL